MNSNHFRMCLFRGCPREAMPAPMRQTCRKHRDAVLVRRRGNYKPRIQTSPTRLRALDAQRAKRGGICGDCGRACRGPLDCACILSERLMAQRPAWDWHDRASDNGHTIVTETAA